MKKQGSILTLMIIVIIVLSLVDVSFSNRITTDGVKLTVLDEKIINYKRDNIIIEEQVLQTMAFSNLEKKAQTLGFVQQNLPIYLSTPLPLALKQ